MFTCLVPKFIFASAFLIIISNCASLKGKPLKNIPGRVTNSEAGTSGNKYESNSLFAKICNKYFTNYILVGVVSVKAEECVDKILSQYNAALGIKATRVYCKYLPSKESLLPKIITTDELQLCYKYKLWMVENRNQKKIFKDDENQNQRRPIQYDNTETFLPQWIEFKTIADVVNEQLNSPVPYTTNIMGKKFSFSVESFFAKKCKKYIKDYILTGVVSIDAEKCIDDVLMNYHVATLGVTAVVECLVATPLQFSVWPHIVRTKELQLCYQYKAWMKYMRAQERKIARIEQARSYNEVDSYLPQTINVGNPYDYSAHSGALF